MRLRLRHVPMGSQTGQDPEDHPRWDGERILPYGQQPSATYVHPLTRNRSLAGRLRWWLLPWLAYAWRYRDDYYDAPNPGHWYHHCWGSFALWLDNRLERRVPLWPPMPPIECDCDYCRGVPGARFEP